MYRYAVRNSGSSCNKMHFTNRTLAEYRVISIPQEIQSLLSWQVSYPCRPCREGCFTNTPVPLVVAAAGQLRDPFQGAHSKGRRPWLTPVSPFRFSVAAADGFLLLATFSPTIDFKVITSSYTQQRIVVPTASSSHILEANGTYEVRNCPCSSHTA